MRAPSRRGRRRPPPHHLPLIFITIITLIAHIPVTQAARRTTSTTTITATAAVTEGARPLTELLSSLDQQYPCGHVVEAEHFLATAVALKFPRLIQLAHFFANHSKNFDPQLLDKSSFLPYPPFEVSFAKRTHFYGLQLNCSGSLNR
uniref:Uncharacterized protein n=1 Tax=Caenorhabditis japonica TaxID=281687 RepID=A0A8R1EQY0_CAEJA